MTPDVPLALRTSATLLFGVVRIHSIKCDKLHSDYIQLLRRSLSNASRPAKLNLPDISTQPPVEDNISRPLNFGLDAFDRRLFHFDGSPDNHVLSEDEITLKDKYYHATNQLYVSDDTRVPDRELMRDPDENDIVLPSILLPHLELATSKPNSPPSGQTTKRCIDTDTPNSVRTSTPQMQPTVSPRGSGPSSPRIAETQFETGSFDLLKTSELELRASPSPSLQRRRKRDFDETLVLNNTFLQMALNDTSDLVKKRKKLPSSSLELWRFMNSKNNERLFLNPLKSGMCTSLQYLSSKDLFALNSIPAESPVRGPQFNDEIEHHLRSPDRDHGHNFGQVFSPSQQFIFRDAATSKSARIPSMVTEPGNTDMDMDTPSMNDDDQTTPRVEDLSFLEQNNNSPPGYGSDSMSVRTRGVAQYLKNRSPLSRLTDATSPDELSLNAILEGRSRKLSARMFYETLVLNDCRLIDVKQDEPYADIILKLSSGISMAKLD